MGRVLKALIFGGAIGATLGVLYAPRAGKKTREMIAEKTDAIWGDDSFKDNALFNGVAKTTKAAVNAGQNFISEANKKNIENLKKEVSQKSKKIKKQTDSNIDDFQTENVRQAFSEKDEALRKKIDVARAKIASQVAQNIDNDGKKQKPVKTESTKTSSDEKSKKKK